MEPLMKGIFGFVILLILMTMLPEVVSTDAMFLGIAIIIGGAVANSS